MNVQGKIAFVTGAASGIGYALAQQCAERGMTVLMADLDESLLADAAQRLRASGATAETFVLDVADLDAYRTVAATILERFGAPYLLCNNAGVAWKGPAASATPEDWRWLVSVNVLGVGYGLSLFVPEMIKRGEGGYILNTGSITSLITSPGASAVYGATKHAVAAVSEALAHEVHRHGIRVAVLCPGTVATRIADADRAAPTHMRAGLTSPSEKERQATHRFVSTGLAPEYVAKRAFAALSEGRFYVVPHPEYKADVEHRHRQIESAFVGEPATDVALLAQAKAAASGLLLT